MGDGFDDGYEGGLDDQGIIPGAVQAPSADDYGGGFLGSVESGAAQAWNNLLGAVDDTFGVDPNNPTGASTGGGLSAVVNPVANAVQSAAGAVSSILPGSTNTWYIVLAILAVIGILLLIVQIGKEF